MSETRLGDGGACASFQSASFGYFAPHYPAQPPKLLPDARRHLSPQTPCARFAHARRFRRQVVGARVRSGRGARNADEVAGPRFRGAARTIGNGARRCCERARRGASAGRGGHGRGQILRLPRAAPAVGARHKKRVLVATGTKPCKVNSSSATCRFCARCFSTTSSATSPLRCAWARATTFARAVSPKRRSRTVCDGQGSRGAPPRYRSSRRAPKPGAARI